MSKYLFKNLLKLDTLHSHYNEDYELAWKTEHITSQKLKAHRWWYSGKQLPLKKMKVQNCIYDTMDRPSV